MKKLIVFSVIFALLAGSVFAVDLGGVVFGGVNVLEGSSAKKADPKDAPDGEKADIGASGYMKRIRLEGAGEAGENFGGWLRFDPTGGSYYGGFASGIAWWKPIDMLKVAIGGNPDGIYTKDGVTGWMFYQMASDAADITNPNQVWYAPGGYYGRGPQYRTDAFYGGFGEQGLMLELTPMEMLAINVAIPYMRGGEVKNVYAHTTAQVDLNLDFGEITITYQGGTNEVAYTPAYTDDDGKDHKAVGPDADPSRLFAYFGLTAIENLGIDVGIGFPFPNKDDDIDYKRNSPIGIGLGVKFTTDAFGVKLRTAATLAGKTTYGDVETKDPFGLGVDILPFYKVSDELCIFLSAGINMSVPDEGDSVVGFHVNPYVQVGGEWGPSFWAGFKLWSDGADYDNWKKTDTEKVINWAIPVAIQVSF